MLQQARRDLIRLPDAERLSAAGMTWKSLSGWLGGPMDYVAWAAIIPSMGYMALLRNLRNFDQAGVLGRCLRDGRGEAWPTRSEVARTRQFPFRFLSARGRAVAADDGDALERALTALIG